MFVLIPHNAGRLGRVVGRRSSKYYPEIYTVKFTDGSHDNDVIPKWMAPR